MQFKRLTGALGALVLGVVGAVVVGSSTAQATTENISVESVCNAGWYVNPDEGSRIPVQGENGLVFQPADLVHHEASIALGALSSGGTFVADPQPDQDSFFSVEVRDTNSNYGTLRWDGTVWSITIGAGGDATAGTFTDANPVTLLTGKRSKWGTANFDTAATTVVSFGVGYTLNPPGSVETTVSSVTFNGVKYLLDCPAKPVDENVTGEKWECDGYFTRGGTVKYTWDQQTHSWTKGEPTWGGWVKQRALTDEELANLGEQCVAPTTPPATTPPATTPPVTTPPVSETPKECEAYVYTGSEVTLCDRFADVVGDEVKCDDVGYQVTLTGGPQGVDPWKLDQGGTPGWGCEDKPLRDFPQTESPVPAGNNGDGGNLAKTGSPILMIGGAGALLFVAGAGILLLTIRRRREEQNLDQTAQFPAVQ